MPALSSWARLRNWQPAVATQLVGGLLLAGLLLLATLYDEALYGLFGGWGDRAGRALGASKLPSWLQPGSLVFSLLHQARSMPSVMLYSGLYLVLCLALLFLLVPAGASRRLGLLFYVGVGLTAGLLLLGSQVGGGPTLAGLASQLVHFLVSPLPIAGLVPLLRWAAAPTPPAAS